MMAANVTSATTLKGKPPVMSQLIQQLLPYLPWGALAASLIGPIVSAILSSLLSRAPGRPSDADSRRGLVGASAVTGV
jgi:hypothetical protein